MRYSKHIESGMTREHYRERIALHHFAVAWCCIVLHGARLMTPAFRKASHGARVQASPERRIVRDAGEAAPVREAAEKKGER
jgi:hypothetical protein